MEQPIRHIPCLNDPPKPGRQYVFQSRQNRRRIARRLAAGWSVEQTAMVERAHEGSLRALLRDDGFMRLVAHYQALMQLDPEAQLKRMTELAYAILTDALEAGDIRVAVFVFDQQLKGLNPGRTVAEAVLKSIERSTAVPDPGKPHPARPH